jgi:hypothetical protein
MACQPHGLLDPCVHRRERISGRRDVGLAVELEDQRHLAGVGPEELPGQTDLQHDAVEATLDREVKDVTST